MSQYYERERKKIILVISNDYSVTKDAVCGYFHYDEKKDRIVVVHSNKTGERLLVSVRKYMNENYIDMRKGDRVYFVKKNKTEYIVSKIN